MRKFLYVISISIIFLSACGYYNVSIDKPTEVKEYKEDFNMMLDEFTWIDVTDKCLQYADDLLKGKLSVGKGSSETPEYETDNIGGIDWNMQVGSIPATYQLNLQALMPIQYLSYAYYKTGEKKYMDLAMSFVESWVCYEEDEFMRKDNIYVWDSHGMAMRTENLVYFALIGLKMSYFSPEQIEKINELLTLHSNYLSDESMYYENHNHGAMQDRALILLAFYLNTDNSINLISLAKGRLEKQMSFEFTDEMVSTENSFAYQVFNKDLYRNIMEFMLSKDDSWAKDKLGELKRCDDVEGWMVKPNLKSSGHGETSISNYNKIVGQKGTVLEYVTSKGKNGETPKETSIVYPEAGYYIGREFWTPENSAYQFEDSSWAMFKSSSLSVVHKQDDDNSFQYYAKGNDIFIDPGFFGYVSNDIRKYLSSAGGHNAISVDDKTYGAKKKPTGQSGIIYYNIDENQPYDYVVGENNYFKDVKLLRHFVNFKESIFILDQGFSRSEHKYTQNFQCGPNITIVSSKNDEVLLKVADTGFNVRIKQLGDDTTAEVLMGSEGTEYGLYSPNTGAVEYVNTIRFSATGKNFEFATLITVEDENGNNVDMSSYKWDGKSKEFSYVDGQGINQKVIIHK